MRSNWGALVENDEHFSSPFVHLPDSFGVGREEEGDAGTNLDRVLSLGRESTFAFNKVTELRLSHLALKPARRTFPDSSACAEVGFGRHCARTDCRNWQSEGRRNGD